MDVNSLLGTDKVEILRKLKR